MISQQAITGANGDPDVCHHMASLGHNELTHCGLVTLHGNIDLGQHLLR